MLADAIQVFRLSPHLCSKRSACPVLICLPVACWEQVQEQSGRIARMASELGILEASLADAQRQSLSLSGRLSLADAKNEDLLVQSQVRKRLGGRFRLHQRGACGCCGVLVRVYSCAVGGYSSEGYERVRVLPPGHTHTLSIPSAVALKGLWCDTTWTARPPPLRLDLPTAMHDLW